MSRILYARNCNSGGPDRLCVIQVTVPRSKRHGPSPANGSSPSPLRRSAERTIRIQQQTRLRSKGWCRVRGVGFYAGCRGGWSRSCGSSGTGGHFFLNCASSCFEGAIRAVPRGLLVLPLRHLTGEMPHHTRKTTKTTDYHSSAGVGPIPTRPTSKNASRTGLQFPALLAFDPQNDPLPQPSRNMRDPRNSSNVITKGLRTEGVGS